MIIDTWTVLASRAPGYADSVVANLTVDGLPYSGNVEVIVPGKMAYLNGHYAIDGLISLQALPEKYSKLLLYVVITKDGRIFSSEPVVPDNVVTYDLAISTTGAGGGPTGDPATINGKVERVRLSELRNGSLITVKGESVGAGGKVFVQDGEVKGAAPSLAQYDVEVEEDQIKNQDPTPVFF